MRATLLGILCSAALGCPSGQTTVADSGNEHDGGPVADGGLMTDGGLSGDGGLVVQLTSGAIEGVSADGTFVFRGIPYAAPPLGALRWGPPQPVVAWSGVRPASQFGSECTQLADDGGILGAEDCLVLNVWTPLPSTTPSRPVLVFIHGGGLSQGSGSQPIYDGAALARRSGALVVTINYRLGIMGFLAHRALSAEVPANTSGSYGILDQLAALRWVQANIAAFGGDPLRVTLSGESAGATSVAALLASPLARGLFARAILQSPGLIASPTLAEAEVSGQAYADQLGCTAAPSVVDCLRAVPVATLLRLGAFSNFRFQDLVQDTRRHAFLPLIDGQLLTEQPLTSFRQGRHNQVPVMVGTTGLEAGYFALTRVLPVVTNQATFMSATTSLLGANAATVRAAYPVANDFAAREAYLTLLSDGAFVCRSRTLVRALAPNQTAPVFRFLFTPVLRGPQSAFGSFHTLELLFLFQTLDRYNYAPNANELATTRVMQDLWGRFVSTGDPNGVGGPRWPALSGQRDDTLELGGSFGVLTELRSPQCDVWDSLSLYD